MIIAKRLIFAEIYSALKSPMEMGYFENKRHIQFADEESNKSVANGNRAFSG